jgi:hypothetical protein
MFLPISSRAGFQPYQALEPDLRRVADPAVAPGSLTSGDRIGGADRAPGALTGAFAGAPMIFVLGDNVPTAVRTLRGAADQAQLAALRAYRVVRTIRSGDLYLTVYQRNSAA